MYKLKLLIVFLLVGFKSFSQIDTQKKDSIVVLSEREARLTAIDLVKYDSCKELVKEKDNRIVNLQKVVTNLENQVSINNDIISGQKDYIQVQNEILKKPKKIEFHGYAGVRSNELSTSSITAYGNLLIEHSKWATGLNYNIRSEEKASWGIIVQYKIF
jgi:hypothetical protein